MMVVGFAPSVDGLAFGACEEVDLARLGKCLKVVIDGRQPGTVPELRSPSCSCSVR